jgi:glycosyltransferase involved in cell wall biosynthesis
MNILYLATKPPWPPIDGGRLLMHTTLEDLSARGHRVTVVAPVAGPLEVIELTARALERVCEPVLVPSGPAAPLGALVRSRLRGLPLSIERHQHPAVVERVASLLDEGDFDLVHVEQQQALYAAEPAFDKGVPVVLRAQNVESALWRGTARATPWWSAWHWLGRSEARRLARWEGKAVLRADATVALTEEDAAQLRQLRGEGGEEDKVHVVRVPFPAELPPADAPLPGEPAVVVLGSVGWLPNQDGVEWLLDVFWPTVHRRLPGARLHLFGEAGDWPRRYPQEEITYHPPPEDSRTAFPPGSILLVPLRIASGVRMKILEAWARGIPVIATPVAASGLGAADGRELRIVANGTELADALEELVGEPEAASKRVEAGRAALRERHDRRAVVEELLAVYRALTPSVPLSH